MPLGINPGCNGTSPSGSANHSTPRKPPASSPTRPSGKAATTLVAPVAPEFEQTGGHYLDDCREAYTVPNDADLSAHSHGDKEWGARPERRTRTLGRVTQDTQPVTWHLLLAPRGGGAHSPPDSTYSHWPSGTRPPPAILPAWSNAPAPDRHRPRDLSGEDYAPGRAVMTGVVVPAAAKPRFREVSVLSRGVTGVILRAG